MGKQYTISEIVSDTGITRRTIHYYIKKKLIPPAHRPKDDAGAGGGAYYSDDHVIRLKLIKLMKNDHFKLSGIREALDGMTISQMEDIHSRAKAGNANWDFQSLQNRMVESEENNLNDPQNSAAGISGKGLTNETKNEDDYNYLKHLKRTSLPDSSWNRFYVIDGVEINIRSDVMKKYKTEVMWWIKYLRGQV